MSTELRSGRYDRHTGLLFMLPGVGIISLCVLLPALLALVLSFTHCSRFGTINWAGIYNYHKLITDPVTLKSFLNTLKYVIVFVPANLALSLSISLVLNRQFPGRKAIRSVYYVPVVVSGVVAVSIFRFIFDKDFGPINSVLSTIGFQPVPWLWTDTWAMWSIIAMDLWKSSAFFSIIFLAGLQSVPRELQEAATVDGAGRLQVFRSVIIPSLRSVTQAVVVLSTIGAFRVFVPMYVLTQGGPAYSTNTVALQAYFSGFRDGELGYSSAVSFALLAFILIVTSAMNRIGRQLE